MVKLSDNLVEVLRGNYNLLVKRYRSPLRSLNDGTLSYRETVKELESILVFLKSKGVLDENTKLFYLGNSEEIAINEEEGCIVISELRYAKSSSIFTPWVSVASVFIGLLLVSSATLVLYLSSGSSSKASDYFNESKNIVSSSENNKDNSPKNKEKVKSKDDEVVKQNSSSQSSNKENNRVDVVSSNVRNTESVGSLPAKDENRTSSNSETSANSSSSSESQGVASSTPNVSSSGAQSNFSPEIVGGYNSTITITGSAPVIESPSENAITTSYEVIAPATSDVVGSSNEVSTAISE